MADFFKKHIVTLQCFNTKNNSVCNLKISVCYRLQQRMTELFDSSTRTLINKHFTHETYTDPFSLLNTSIKK